MADETATVEAPATPVPAAVTPPQLDDNAVRAAMEAMDKRQADAESGFNPTDTSIPVELSPTTDTQVPDKFKNDDGTVDVEKLKTSTRQLDEAIQSKELTIEDMLSQYREKEAKFRNLPNPAKLEARLNPAAPATENPLGILNQPGKNPQEEAIRQQIIADFNADPVATMIRLSEIVAERKAAEKLAPIQRDIDSRLEVERENYLRSSLKEAAQADPRILQPQMYSEVLRELDADPGYWALKNPHEVAWLKVKARLRIGEHQAQPSRPITPIIGGGLPPPVPRADTGLTQQNLAAAMRTAKTPEEISKVDKLMRQFLEKVDASVR